MIRKLTNLEQHITGNSEGSTPSLYLLPLSGFENRVSSKQANIICVRYRTVRRIGY